MKKYLFLQLLLLALSTANGQSVSDSIKVSPNPFSQRTLITYTIVNNDTIWIDILDVTGAVKLSPKANFLVSPGAYQDSLIMNGFPDGMYYAVLKNRQRHLGTVKIVKSGTTSIQEQCNDLEINMYPNPVRDKLYLKFESSFQTNFCVRIIDAFGRSIYASKLSDLACDLDLSLLSPGPYYLVFENSALRKIFKFLKE